MEAELKAEFEKFLNDNLEFEVKSKRFRNRKTGEIKTQIPLLDICDYDEVDDNEE